MLSDITAVILTKNEEKNITECIKTLDFCQEIVIIDDNSTDSTLEQIKKLKDTRIKVIAHPLNQNFANQRNFALKHATSKWVLFIDADERISASLQKEISLKIHNFLHVGYVFKRSDYMWGKKLRYGETSKVRFLRLATKGSGVWQGNVHETWNVNGKIGEMEKALDHYPHQSIREFIAEIDAYTTIRAKELFDKGVTSNIFSILFYPKAKFIQNYIFRLGFLDGIPGFLVAIFMSFHSYLVRSKLYLLHKKS